MNAPNHAPDHTYRLEPKDLVAGIQVFIIAFGGLTIVPLFLGMDPSIALFTAGVSTIIYQMITKGSVPVFLASSTTFTAPIFYSISYWGLPATFGGMISIGIVYILFGALIKQNGPKAILTFLPPIVTGPVIFVIGMIVVPLGIERVQGLIGSAHTMPSDYALIISMTALGTTILFAVFTKGLLSLTPILAGVVAGTLAGYAIETHYQANILDFSVLTNAPWIAVPKFVVPEFEIAAIIFFIPVAFIPAIEQFGDMLSISSITGKNYLKSPGIATTMTSEGVATIVATSFGGPPPTTYSEVHKAVAITNNFNPAVMTFAALFAIALAFVGKLGALLTLIPLPALSGVLLLMFASMMVIGLNTLVQSRENLLVPRNLIIVSAILVVGVGGLEIVIGDFVFRGVGFATLVGVLLNLALPTVKHTHE